VGESVAAAASGSSERKAVTAAAQQLLASGSVNQGGRRQRGNGIAPRVLTACYRRSRAAHSISGA